MTASPKALQARLSPEELARRSALLAESPFHNFLGLKLNCAEPGRAEIEFTPMENVRNGSGVLHGGIIYSILDVAAYAALLPCLTDRQEAVTHDIHCSVLQPARLGQPVVFQGRVRKLGKRLAFCESEAWAGENLIALARVTKSIIELG